MSTTIAAYARAVSSWGIDWSVRRPRPFSEPEYSARTAAIAAIATARRVPVKSAGSALGASAKRSTCQREAPRVRSSLRRSGSMRPSASRVGTTIGKKQTSATMKSFGRTPKPNHVTSSGAMSTIGMTCVPTSSG